MSRNRIFGLTSRFLMCVVAGLLILSYASMFVNPAHLWFISLSGLFFVPLSIINLILLLWAVRRLSKSFIIPLLALLPSFFFIGRYVRFPKSEESPVVRTLTDSRGESSIRMMTYNVGRFALNEAKEGIYTKTQCADSIFAFIRSQDADIICLQEFRMSGNKDIRSYLSKHFSGYDVQYYIFPETGGSFGNVTLSRVPVTGKGKIRFEGSTNLAIYTDHVYKGQPFRVYNCHFESYNISFTGLVRALFTADEQVFEETGSKMKRSLLKRPKQVDQVLENMEDCPVESFVCGDFNDNPMSYTYYRLTRGRDDSFVEAGLGFGATYANMWPMLRIDYVLYPKRYDAVSHDIPRVEYSDHYPVITEIEI